MSDNILVLGGDGFCGWPTALRLSAAGYRVSIVDNLSRRRIDEELGCESLTPIRSIDERIAAWTRVTGRPMDFHPINIATEFKALLDLIEEKRPRAIVHFAEQRAAPYSMKSAEKKRYTVDNNVPGTHNVLCAIVESGLDVHLVHLGTMGVYGYGTAGIAVPEGYLNVKVDVGPDRQKEIEILYPAHPGSVYHTTKTLDALLFYFYNRNDNVRITDLHQGIVWGTQTPETELHDDLVNRFDYDGDYGTVLNRFLMQAAIGHPLTIYGTGGQTRAFIHIRDTARCIQLAVENPPAAGERVEIFNQATETHTLLELADKVSRLTGADIRFYANPRKEQAENTLRIRNRKFLELGLNPTTLDDGLMAEIVGIAERHKNRCDRSKIYASSRWTKDQSLDREGSRTPQGVEHSEDRRAASG
ncbi:MAG: NAD-dependent epimerase/dehydratase family protein [Rhodospirillaceae bacterium]|nr:NAD-dependent epimerase/dehydratase family protein [Rhodospirillaceae bacterium]